MSSACTSRPMPTRPAPRRCSGRRSTIRCGALLVLGEDYGEGSSIIQERTHAFAMKSQIWLVDPRPNLPKIVQLVEKGFQLSEVSSTPVMLELRIRACHVKGAF